MTHDTVRDDDQLKPPERDEEPTGEPDTTADASLMTEGVGGMPDLEPHERATISDVDGDNVETERPKPQV